MVFYKDLSDLSEKIQKISRDEKLRKKIAKKGKTKYMKYFNSNEVAEFIINKTLAQAISRQPVISISAISLFIKPLLFVLSFIKFMFLKFIFFHWHFFLQPSFLEGLRSGEGFIPNAKALAPQ